MQLSQFGQKFSAPSGVVQLMRDLGEALHDRPDMISMGGGNPALLPAVAEQLRERLSSALTRPSGWQRMLGAYQSPQGDPEFRRVLATSLASRYGWPLSADNIAVANGSQSAYFILYNLFAGIMRDGSERSIHLPMAPEYIGYADVGLSPNFFTATAPDIEYLDDRLFKYHMRADALSPPERAGALCVSRPTNPTGNMLTDAEMEQLERLARERDLPLIVDGAYGAPFPDITFVENTPHWTPHTVLTLSLSKLGLPGLRTGIIIAREDIIEAFCNANTIISLASASVGPALAAELLDSGMMWSLSEQHIRPFYRERAAATVAWLHEALEGLPYRIHRPEGAFFLWLWFEDLPAPSAQLYQRLKQRGVLALPGEEFFIGIDPSWPHRSQCLRLSYAQDPAAVRRGVELLGDVVHELYEHG